MPFENVGLTSEQSKRLGTASSDTEGFRPLVLEAIDGPNRPLGTGGPAPKPFKVNQKTEANTPGIHNADLHGTSEDGGKVTYDRAGNIVSWESKDKLTTRIYTYHDSDVDRASLYQIPNQSLYQDKNGTYFQFSDLNGHKTPTAKLVTRAFDKTVFSDLRGASDSASSVNRAVDEDGAPVVVPVSIIKDLKISATLDVVTDNHGHIWKRDYDGKPLVEYTTNAHGKEVKDGKSATDAQLLPVDLYVSAARQKLYNDAKNPLASVKLVSVEQTELGDCYFEAPLSEVAHKEPKRILEMIKDNHDGTYTVKFPLSDPTFSSAVPFNKRPTLDVTVEAPTPPELSTFDIPFNRGQNNGYWSSVMEKAHRYLTGKITNDDGGVGSDSLQLLTGVRRVSDFEHYANPAPGDHSFLTRTYTQDPRDTQDEKLAPEWVKTVKLALDRGESVVARTPQSSSEWVVVAGGTDDKRVLGFSKETGNEKNEFHILDKHVYAVIKVDSDKNDGDIITVRNPLANVIPSGAKDNVRPFDQKDNGYFQVRPADFEKLFEGFFIN